PLRSNDCDNLDQEEVDVLIRLCMPDEAIAQELNLEIDEVASISERVLKKMRVSKATAAVAKAIQMGYLMLPRQVELNDKGVSLEQVAAEEMALRAIGESARAE